MTCTRTYNGSNCMYHHPFIHCLYMYVIVDSGTGSLLRIHILVNNELSFSFTGEYYLSLLIRVRTVKQQFSVTNQIVHSLEAAGEGDNLTISLHPNIEYHSHKKKSVQSNPWQSILHPLAFSSYILEDNIISDVRKGNSLKGLVGWVDNANNISEENVDQNDTAGFERICRGRWSTQH